MTDKIQKIHEVIEKRYKYWKEKEFNSHSIESEIRMSECQHLLLMVDSLQEELVEKDFEKALAAEWKGYIDRGVATVDALEENTQELAFAKGFYRGAKWKEQKDSIVSKDLEEACEQLAENARKHKAETISPFFSPTDYKQGVIDGANWKKQQMMEKAIDVVIGNEWGHPRCVLTQYDLEPLGIRSKDRVKVIVVKED